MDSARLSEPNTTCLSAGSNEKGRGWTNPVSQPLLVVVGSWRLDGLDGEVSRERPSDEVGHGLSEAEEVEEDQSDGAVA